MPDAARIYEALWRLDGAGWITIEERVRATRQRKAVHRLVTDEIDQRLGPHPELERRARAAAVATSVRLPRVVGLRQNGMPYVKFGAWGDEAQVLGGTRTESSSQDREKEE